MARLKRRWKHVSAAGGVVWRRRSDDKPEFLVIHRPRYDDWSLPKGKLDRGETYESCAEREVIEETGYTVKMGDEIGTISYVTQARNAKRVRYWLMKSLDGTFRPNKEVDEIRWLRPRKARAILAYSRDRAVFDRGLQMLERRRSGRIYVVRNALVAGHKPWTGKDRKRPLSKQGRKQAADLADDLARHPVTDVLSSAWARCAATVDPLATLLGHDLRYHPDLARGSSPKKMGALVASMEGRTAVLCTHGDVVRAYVGSLAAAGVPLDGPAKWKNGSTWVLETKKGRVIEGHYLPPAGL